MAGPRRFETAMLVPLLFSALVYAPIVFNSFYSDDFYHLYDLVNSSFLQFLFRTHGGHIYLFRNLVFYVCYLLFRTEPLPYYLLAFATHLLNVVLAYRVIRSCGGGARAAVFGATLWGILPADQGAIGWYSVYGHALATTFTLSVLLRMSDVAAGGVPLRFEAVLWAAGLALGATCFGVGLGLAAAMPVAAFLILPRSAFRRRALLVLTVLVALLPVLYRSVEMLDGALHGEPVEGSSILLTSFRVWWQHAQMLAHLVLYSASGLVFGTFQIVRSFPRTIDLVAAAGLGLLCAVRFASTSSNLRRRSAACALLGIAAYGTIAAGRGMFFDPANQMSSAAAPRFHYAAPCLLAIAFALLLDGWPSFLGPRLKTACLVAWLALMLRGHSMGPGIDHHDNDRRESREVLARIERAVDAARADEVYLENRNFLSIGPLLFGARPLFPGWAALFAVYYPDGFMKGKRVRFVEPDPTVLAARRGGRISARLFVSPEEMPASARVTEYPGQWRRRSVPDS
jgi:hypothetical protein